MSLTSSSKSAQPISIEGNTPCLAYDCRNGDIYLIMDNSAFIAILLDSIVKSESIGKEFNRPDLKNNLRFYEGSVTISNSKVRNIDIDTSISIDTKNKDTADDGSHRTDYEDS